MKNIEEKIYKEVLGNVLRKLRNIKNRYNASKVSFGNYDTWSDPPVAYRDIDLSISENSKNFALLMDKVSELLGLPEPIITSGLRPPNRQVRAMLDIWDREGGRRDKEAGKVNEENSGSIYLINLYGVQCHSCSENAGDIATQLTKLWHTNANPSNAKEIVPTEVIQRSISIINNNPLSAHQSGDALDYGLLTNSDQSIKKTIDYIQDHNLANIELIDERRPGAEGELGTGAGSHWHISVYNITPEGIKFLNTNNEDMLSEKYVLKNLIDLILKEELIKTNK
jgi:hypothetical protein